VNNNIIGKHIFIQHPKLQEGDIEVVNSYYKKKKKFLEESNLLFSKEIIFRNINTKEIEKSIYNIKQVVFETTEKCNLNCVYCAFGDLYSGNEERLKSKRHLKKEDAIKLLEYLYPIWKAREQVGLPLKILIGFYGGEPLLNFPLIEAIVQWAKEHTTVHLEFRFQITTNGLLLDKYIVFLVEHDFMTYISLDGNEKNMEYRVDHKGKNCFKHVYSNILEAKNNYPDFFNTNVNIMSVLHNRNSVEQTVSFCMTQFNKIPNCSRLNDSGIASQKRALFTEMSEVVHQKPSKKTEKAMMKVGAGLTESIHFLMTFSGFHFYDYNELLYKNKMNNNRRVPTGVCIPFSREVYMTINGNLYPCERLDACFSMGNIHDTIVFDIEQITSRLNQYLKNISPSCSICERNYYCDKCLFHIDEIQGNNPKCNNIMNKNKFHEMISSIIAICRKHPELYRKIMKRTIFA